VCLDQRLPGTGAANLQVVGQSVDLQFVSALQSELVSQHLGDDYSPGGVNGSSDGLNDTSDHGDLFVTGGGPAADRSGSGSGWMVT